MRISLVLITLFIINLKVSGQNKLEAFENLIGKTWYAEGQWKDDKKFRQEVTFEYGLDNSMIVARSKGFIDKEQTKFGNRNYGIRKYNDKTHQLEFWEFDIYGGLIHGNIEIEEKDIIYNYEYGGYAMTDKWEYVNDSTYNFIVGDYKDGEWKTIYLETQFRSYDISNQNPSYAIVIHGGAGTITKKNITPEKEKEITNALTEAINLGSNMLSEGKTAMEVVEAVVRYMEDSPLFNAGKGAVFNQEGRQEMDACIMDGRDLSTGAVAGVSHLKNPITGARLVKDSIRHVLLSGERAEKFCISKGAEYADSSYFFVQSRWDYYQKVLERERNEHGDNDGGAAYMDEGSLKYGTVGCVVLDSYGNLAAATSTGGLTNKKYGRIGDSPIVGAGTYADNNSCAVSCTGTGEFFIRGTIARDIAALMEFKGYSLQKAGETTLEKLNRMKGDGGFIGVDGNGNVIMMFNTEGMYRGYNTSNIESPVVRIYGD